MEYLYFKLGSLISFKDIPNNINLNSGNKVKFVPISQINKNITKALNSGNLIQISASEYQNTTNDYIDSSAPSPNSDIIIDTILQYPFYPVDGNFKDKIDRLNLISFQILSNTPEVKFKLYPNYIVRIINKSFHVYKPNDGIIGLIQKDGSEYWEYMGLDYPNGTWEKFNNNIS